MRSRIQETENWMKFDQNAASFANKLIDSGILLLRFIKKASHQLKLYIFYIIFDKFQVFPVRLNG